MSREIENVLAALDGYRMSDQMDYASYSQLYDMISVLDVPGWISVKDRLPEESDGTVLICYPNQAPYNLMEPHPNAKHD